MSRAPPAGAGAAVAGAGAGAGVVDCHCGSCESSVPVMKISKK